MEQLLTTLLKRIKRSIPLIIIIPLLLGAVGYFFQVNAEPVISYGAQTKIELGYYDDLNLNSSSTARSVLTSHDFLEGVFPDHDIKELKAIKRDIEIRTPSDSRMEIKFNADSEEEVREVLSDLVEGFLAYDNEKFEDKYSILEKNYEELKEETVSQDSKVDKQRFIYELQNELLSIYPAKLADPVSVNEYRMEDFSAKKRAVLGGLIGITVIFGYIVIPILFREDSM